MTIAVDPPVADAFPVQPSDALKGPSQEPLDQPVRRTDVRNAGVAFALSNISVDAARALLKKMHEHRRTRVQAQLAANVEQTRIAEQRTAEQATRARADADVAMDRLRKKNELEERVRRLGNAIRLKRHEREAKKIADEVDRLETERSETIERLGRERTLRHNAEVDAWNKQLAERNEQHAQLASLREQLADNEIEIRKTAAERMNQWMTRTACGFLVWAGYTVIGTTGIAVAALLDDSQKKSLLTDVGVSAVKLMHNFSRGRLHPMVAAPLSLLAFLATVVTLLLLIDWLMRWFDKRRWTERRRPQQGYTFPSREDLSRSTFSKLLAAIPFIYISGVVIAFVAYGGTVTSNTALLGRNSAMLNALIGSALSLLSASIFVLYFANIFEPRISSSQLPTKWRTRWEVGIVPFIMLLALVLVAIFGPHSRWAWAGVTAFMLLGAMALAYGLLYRGMFREIDYAARAVVECDRRIEELLEPPEKEDPDRTEKRETDRVLSDYRARRQYLLDLDRERRLRRAFLTSDENDTQLMGVYHIATSSVWRVWVRFRRLGPQPDFYRVTDFEAASIETEARQEYEEQLRAIELELNVLDPETARTRADACEKEHAQACEQRERAEREQPLLLATTDERESVENFDFEGAYAVGTMTKPIFDVINKRRDEAIVKTERPRVKRPAARVHAEEVQSAH